MTMPFGLPPIDPDTDRRVRKSVIEKLAEFSEASMEYYVNNFPGLKEKSGRERLAFYEAQEATYWAELAAKFPAGDYSAVSLMRDFYQLWKLYRQPAEVPLG